MVRHKLKDLSLYNLEYGSGSAAVEYDGHTRYIRITDIDDDGRLNDEVVSPQEDNDKYILKDGDILFARSGATVGKTYRYKEKDGNCIYAGYLIRFIPNQNIINPDYIWYFTKSPRYREYVQNSMKVVAQPNINAKQYGSLEIEVPTLTEQESIIEKLGAVRNIVEHRRQQLRAFDTLIKARFVEMFGDPVSNPKGWEKRSLSDEAEIKIGPFGSLLHKEDYISGGHALVNPSHIADGKIVPDEKLTVSDEKYMELIAYHLKEGDVVMGRRGEMGRCAVVDRPGLLCGTGSLFIRSFGDLSADYIQKIISFPSFKRTIEDMAVGQTMPNLNVPIVSSFQIIKPPKNVQNQYYAFVTQVEKSKSAVQAALNKSQLLFDSLMQQYFG